MKNINIFCKLYIFLNAAFRFGMWHLEYGYEAHHCSWPAFKKREARAPNMLEKLKNTNAPRYKKEFH